MKLVVRDIQLLQAILSVPSTRVYAMKLLLSPELRGLGVDTFSTLDSGLRDETVGKYSTDKITETFSTLDSGLRDET